MENKKKEFRGLNKGKGIDGPVAQTIILLIMIITIFLVALPVLITIVSSIKTNFEITVGVWTWPKHPRWSNWSFALKSINTNMINSIIVCLISSAGVCFLGSVAAYVFARHNFPGKNIIFYMIIALMIVPSVLTITPSFLEMMQLGIKNTWWSLLFPYISGGQVGAIFLFRTFMSQQPNELFEAAKIDGAGDFAMYCKITIPLAIPILAIQFVSCFGAYYNDFLWPSLVIDNESKQMLMPVLKALTSQVSGVNQEQGAAYAMYLLSGIPLIVTTAFGLKYFINGDFAAGMKL